MKRALIGLPFAACATAAVDTPVQPLHDAEIVSADAAGTPTFLRGTLGEHGDRDAVLRITTALGLGAATLELAATRSDPLGTTHLRYQPSLDGIPVIGGDVQLHVNAAGIIYAATRALPLDRIPARVSGADLVYVVTSRDRSLHLARVVEETGMRDGLPFRDRVFIDATSGAIVDRHPQIQPALARRVHDAQHMTVLPGAVAMNEGDAPSADASVAAAYAHSGSAHDCFRALFDRDGIDGGTVVSSVHYGTNVANAFWTGSQLVFGDGDGVDFSDLAQGYDVVVHELTHGVTQHTAGLVYANESGALNEAFSDIMAARCEAWRGHDELTPQVWQLGEDVFTPAIAGDALRYLDDPAADGGSYDFYPDRYRGTGDHGGVHINSGIANLAFRLLATGGTHPRGKTTTVVPALGIDAAGRIFYRALATYLTSTSGFEAARIATTQAALDLY
ncbi:MAG TPA: M4 family metallopeptidase, partial [Kofleriaceae bacterium]